MFNLLQTQLFRPGPVLLAFRYLHPEFQKLGVRKQANGGIVGADKSVSAKKGFAHIGRKNLAFAHVTGGPEPSDVIHKELVHVMADRCQMTGGNIYACKNFAIPN